MSKRKGNRNEHKTIRWLEKKGYRCIRSAASLGPFDIVAFRKKDCLLVQVKTNRTAPPAERRAMAEWDVPRSCYKYIFIWRDYARAPEVREV